MMLVHISPLPPRPVPSDERVIYSSIRTVMMVVTPGSGGSGLSGIAANASEIRSNFPVALALSTLAGLSTGIGGLVVVFYPELSMHRLGLWQGAAAGFMISVSALDLAPTALADLSVWSVVPAFLLGFLGLLLLRASIPEPDLAKVALVKDGDERTRSVLWSGLLTALGIALHNFPEGIAVCAASLRGLQFGAPLALAIGVHNIPEGMAVALPVYYATRSKSFAIRLALFSGLAEPAGVLFVLGLIHVFGVLSKAFVAALLAGVAGVMVALSLAELFPQAVIHCGRRDAVISTISGFIFMSLMLVAIERSGFSV